MQCYCWPVLSIMHMFLVISRWCYFFVSLFKFCPVIIGAFDRVIQQMSVEVYHSMTVVC